MEEDILKYSPTVMFRGTPCISTVFKFKKSLFTVNVSKLFSQQKILKKLIF